jgi:hypothetical protein
VSGCPRSLAPAEEDFLGPTLGSISDSQFKIDCRSLELEAKSLLAGMNKMADYKVERDEFHPSQETVLPLAQTSRASLDKHLYFVTVYDANTDSIRESRCL